jgi:hypothetical protein
MKIPTNRLASVLVCSALLATGCAGSTGQGAQTPDSDNASPVLPASFAPIQGQTAYGVYIVRAESAADPEVERTLADLHARGLTGGVGDLACDHGAADVLGLPPETIVVSVDFETRADAQRFAELWGSVVLGVAEFVAFCRD